MTAPLIPVLWADGSIENPGKEVVLCELDAGTGLVRAYEGEAGEFAPISVSTEQRRVLEKAKLILRGCPETLADGRVLTAMAAVFVAFFERGVDPARMISTPKKKDIAV